MPSLFEHQIHENIICTTQVTGVTEFT